MDVNQVKQRFGIIGNSPALIRAIDIAIQVAPTDMSVLIAGESGTGKENFPKIIHQFSSRKHGKYIAINCGAIPEGTIDSELFGHEKGAFTGAHDHRKGYFEVVDKGTIFLDEIAELPLSTQVRLLRVLETGEFIKVGSSKLQKTDVRVVAATNIIISKAISEGKFREDLFYRLNTVPINIPSLAERKEDIPLLFRKFALDFAERYRMPPLKLDNEALELLKRYRWPGNVRQLKNITEQISIIEKNRDISADVLRHYLPLYEGTKLPVIYKSVDEKTFTSEREILYKILFDMKNDMSDLKSLVHEIIQDGYDVSDIRKNKNLLIQKIYNKENDEISMQDTESYEIKQQKKEENTNIQDTEEIIEESLSLVDKEIEFIKKALEKYKGKRKIAAQELGISERTLYRKIKEYNLD
ncbi:MAG: sigma-54-dependent Fis family transcriptional regulator [Bacteroidales bacterium]|nr:sigma-54-dependent Fis family transcriptional regulator [Bacteroidales bacterium]